MTWILFRLVLAGGFLAMCVGIAPGAAAMTLTVAGAGAVFALAVRDWANR